MKKESEMTISEIMLKMIAYSQGNHHDINHFLKVYAYAKTIAECEGASPFQQQTVEIASILHDIACPLCRKKYGNTHGKRQEAEGVPLAEEFLKDSGVSNDVRERVVFLVGHHHTIDEVDGLDYQILLEADYLVNAEEAGYPAENVQHAEKTLFKTSTGRSLLQEVYQLPCI
ncbi:HD domain-containing protein [Oscillibacter sp.]|uniref:HD domain-containing protein n=1 Tax=Oscillibacter sp. TaxID=1945593 RepID=UPI002D7FAB73|nr:HD domain-containing protein [Oscillibacter sp.]